MASENKLWHDDVTTWLDRNSFLFDKDFMSDCSFIVEENDQKIKVPAHKYILGGVCLDFYNLFYLMEADTNEIPITDVSVSHFKVFLKYIYTGKTELTMDNIRDVLKLVGRFSIKCFKDYCEEFLSEQLSSSTYFKIMDDFSEEISSNGMQQFHLACLRQMTGEDLLKSQSFLEIKLETLAIILGSDQSRVKEIDLFLAASKWAANHCEQTGLTPNSENKRSVLGKTFMDIRFGSMTAEEFAQCIEDDPILTTSEENLIFRSIGRRGKTECLFSDVKRGPVITEKLILQSDAYKLIKYKERSNSISTNFYLTFSVSKSVKIGGVGVRLNFEIPSEMPEELLLELMNYDDYTVVLENTVEIMVTKQSTVHELLFKESFMLEANIKYVIRVSFKCPDASTKLGDTLLHGNNSETSICFAIWPINLENFSSDVFSIFAYVGLVD